MNELSDFFSLKEFFLKTVKLYISIIKFILKSLIKLWYISLILVLLLGFGFYIKSKSIETSYSAKTSYTFNYLNKKVYGDLLFDIEKSIDKSDYKAVAKLLNIPIETAEFIKKFKAVNIVGSPLNEDFTPMFIPFYIDIELTNIDNLTLIQKGITDLMRNDLFIRGKVQEKLNYNRAKLNLINSFITKLDSLRLQIQTKDIDKLAELISLSNTKFEEKNKISINLKKTEAVNILKPFVAIKTEKNILIKELAIKYIALFLFFSILISSVLHWYKIDTNVK